MRENHYCLNDFGVLVRTNSLMNTIETTFVESQLPVCVSGGSSFFDRKEIRDMLCFLKILVNESDDNSLLRIINTPRRGIGRTTVEKLRRYADDHNTTLHIALEELSASTDFRESTRNALQDFVKLIHKWMGMTGRPERLIETILADTEYEAMVREEFPDSDKAVAFKMRGIHFLTERMNTYIKEHPGTTLRDYLRSVSIIGDDSKDDELKISLMTMHASKGLEFKIVFLAGIEDHIIPSARALEEDSRNIDEERRLFYVAITRAKEKLFINYADTRRDREGKEKIVLPSRFLEEIPNTLFKNEEKTKEETLQDNINSAKSFLEMLKNRNKNK